MQYCSYPIDQGIDCVECKTGETRLAEPESEVNYTRGRVEVCINRAWGTVCNASFDKVDAEIACGNVAGYTREGMGLGYTDQLSNYAVCYYRGNNSFQYIFH